MDITVTQIIYAVVFVSILLAVEGVYLFIRGSDTRERTANRRMKVAEKQDARILNPSIMREKIVGGPFSQTVFRLAPSIEALFWVANVNITPAAGAALCGALTVAAYFALVLLASFPPSMTLFASFILGCGVPYMMLKMKADSERAKFSAQLPDAINLITRGLQAGHPVPVAFELVAREMPDPLGGQFGKVIDEINFGRDRDTALREIAAKFPDPDFKFFLAAVEMQRETGGNLVSILDNLTKIIRERSTMRKKAWAMSAEGRLTCVIVGALPYLLFGFLMMTNPAFILDVVDDPMFWPLMGGAWFLWLIGILWIWRMVNIKV